MLPALLAQAVRLMEEEAGAGGGDAHSSAGRKGEAGQSRGPVNLLLPRPLSASRAESSSEATDPASSRGSDGRESGRGSTPEPAGSLSQIQQPQSRSGSARLPPSPIQPQFLSNVTWALARLQYHEDAVAVGAFLRHVERLFPLLLPGAASTQNLSNVLWAFATLEHRSEALFSALRPQIERLALLAGGGGHSGATQQLSPQALSNISWAYAKAGMVRKSTGGREALCVGLERWDGGGP